jgi:membrane fusion protein, heavy metal efflux system
MPTQLSWFRPANWWLAGGLIVLVILEAACAVGSTEAGSKGTERPVSERAAAVQPVLFTVPQDQMAHLKVVPVESRIWPVAVHTTGTVDWDADQTTQAITQVNGPITRILVDTGARVKAGDPLLYVSSPDVANAMSTYRKARNREVFNKRVVDRQRDLLERGAVTAKDLESAEADYNDAMTDVQNSLQPLRIFGITAQEIDLAEKQGTTISNELAVRAPITGMVVQKMVSPGMLVQAGVTACFMISNVNTVWVQGHIFDRDLPLVKIGDAVLETNPASSRTFHGTVNYVGAFVDPATRTTPVRIVTQNPEGLLKKDMFVEAVIATSTKSNALAVPVSAVLRDDKNEPVVYVQAEPGKFAQRSVSIGAQQDGMVAISSGLQKGENVLADGSIFIQFATGIQ